MNNKIDLVCIIDDDPIYIFAIKKLLNINNIANKYLIYNNGKDAIEGLKNNKLTISPDLILLDINMPIMDGWQFLEAFKELNLVKTIPLFIVSSSISSVDINKAEQHNLVKGYICKPIDGKKLIEIKQIYSNQN